jgi:hypothetical protein
MKLVVWPKLSTRSRRALVRTQKRNGSIMSYTPRIRLIKRLQRELGMSESEVIAQVEKERAYILKTLAGIPD